MTHFQSVDASNGFFRIDLFWPEEELLLNETVKRAQLISLSSINVKPASIGCFKPEHEITAIFTEDNHLSTDDYVQLFAEGLLLSRADQSIFKWALLLAIVIHLGIAASFLFTPQKQPILLAVTTPSLQATIMIDPAIKQQQLKYLQHQWQSVLQNVNQATAMQQQKLLAKPLAKKAEIALKKVAQAKSIKKQPTAKSISKPTPANELSQVNNPHFSKAITEKQKQPVSQMPLNQTPEALNTMPKALYQVQPNYPRVALMRGLQGYVVVRFIIRQDGTVNPDSIAIIKTTSDAFSLSARQAVAQWRFAPRQRPAIVEQQVDFKLINSY